jgi:hypothetical protein
MIRQLVIDDRFSLLQKLQAADGDQICSAGAGSDHPDKTF